MPTKRIPAQEYIAGRLHQPLAFDHPLALVLEEALAGEGCEDGLLRFFHLQEEGVLSVSPQQECHVRPGAYATHAHYLARGVDHAVALQQVSAVALQRPAVGAKDGAHVVQQPLVFDLGQEFAEGHEYRAGR